MFQRQRFASDGKIKIGVRLYALPGCGMAYNTRSECIKLLMWRVFLYQRAYQCQVRCRECPFQRFVHDYVIWGQRQML